MERCHRCGYQPVPAGYEEEFRTSEAIVRELRTSLQQRWRRRTYLIVIGMWCLIVVSLTAMVQLLLWY